MSERSILPGEDGQDDEGLALLASERRMRAGPRTQRLPMVVLTSSKEEPGLLTSYDHGANSYVRKPVDFVRFGDTILQLQMYWLVLNEAPTTNGDRP